jgi:hypothetical protein
MLLGRQIFVRSSPGAHEGRNQERWAHGIHQAKPDRLDEALGVIKSAQRGPVKVPLLTAELVEFLVSHKNS